MDKGKLKKEIEAIHHVHGMSGTAVDRIISLLEQQREKVKAAILNDKEIREFAHNWSEGFGTEHANRSIAYTSYHRGCKRIIKLLTNQASAQTTSKLKVELLSESKLDYILNSKEPNTPNKPEEKKEANANKENEYNCDLCKDTGVVVWGKSEINCNCKPKVFMCNVDESCGTIQPQEDKDPDWPNIPVKKTIEFAAEVIEDQPKEEQPTKQEEEVLGRCPICNTWYCEHQPLKQL